MIDFVASTIPVRIQFLAIGASALLFLVIVDLIRQGRLKEGYSIIWFFISLGLVFFSLFTPLLDVMARLVGIAYTPAALFLFLVLLSLHYSVLVTRYDRRIRELAQAHAILKAELSHKDAKK